jgi:hypothetical protein
MGQVKVLSSELTIQLAPLDAESGGAAQAAMEFVEFYPTGRATPARVRITLNTGDIADVADVVCASPAEEFRLIGGAGGGGGRS